MSDEKERFCMYWEAGPTAQVELFSPGAVREGYCVKYTSPFRSTIRPPLEDVELGPGELGPINDRLDSLVKKLVGRAGPAAAGPVATSARDSDVLQDLMWLGDELLTILIPSDLKAHLRMPELFLEIGIDEKLVNYPWELMHDGQDFLCLKHAVGRFVNARAPSATQERPSVLVGSPMERLSILLISVPKPDHGQYEELPEAEAESEAIIDCLQEVKGVDVHYLPGKKAKHNEVYQTLRKSKYHVIHYNGHAHFDEEKPYLSGLVLYDRLMTTGYLLRVIGSNPPILCFVNACETTKAVRAVDSASRLDIYSLARAFLDTGAYLLGSRWKIRDVTAKEFATEFYTRLIEDEEPIGKAIIEARKACRPSDVFGWASYVYYGDPRLCFRRLPPPTGTATPV